MNAEKLFDAVINAKAGAAHEAGERLSIGLQGGITASRVVPSSVLKGTTVSPRVCSQSKMCGSASLFANDPACIVQQDHAAIVSLCLIRRG